MPEMTHAGKDHGDIMLIGCGYDFIIAHRTAGLDDGGDARFGRGIDAVPNGKKASEAIAEPGTSKPASAALIPAILAE